MHKFLFYIKIYYTLLHVSSTVVLITSRSKLYYTASGIIKPVGCHPVHILLSTFAPDGYPQSVMTPDAV